MIDASFLDLMPDTVVLLAPAGRNAFGELTQSTQVSVRARVATGYRELISASGERMVSTAQVWLYGAEGATPAHHVQLPDGTVRRILTVERLPDEAGAHHEKLWLGT